MDSNRAGFAGLLRWAGALDGLTSDTGSTAGALDGSGGKVGRWMFSKLLPSR
jgi:hypothetical protein